MSSMRVAMIIQNYHPIVGGAERQLAALAPRLQAEGVEVHVVTRRDAGLRASETVGGVPVHRLSAPGPKAMASFAFTLSALPALRRLRPDVVHAHGLLSAATTALAARRALRVPMAAKVLRGGELGDLARVRAKPFAAPRLRRLRDEVDAFAVISREIDGELAALGVPAERRAFVPNGVDADRFQPASAAERESLRASLALPDGPLAVFAGRLDPEKRVDLLLAVWPQVRAAHPGVELLVLGTGSVEASLRASAPAGVRFFGGVDDVAPYLRVADVFVLPSLTEGLSNAILEAMACGLPAIATRVGGNPDLIDDGEHGLLVPPGDGPALLEAIRTVFGDLRLGAKMGHAGRERAVCSYSLAVTVDRLRALYATLVDRGTKARPA